MSMGIPTMITKTKGFWDYSKFEHKENIIFMESNNIEDWVLMINNLIEDEKLRNHIGQKSIENTKVNYNLEIFYAKLKEIMFT
jgi:glycosyltransferase involved in cell wall biosynthesis